MCGDLRGMFAFALWDARKQAKLPARDPVGVKPQRFIVADVAHNVWFGMYSGVGVRVLLNWQVLLQIVFLVFVLLTIRTAWQGTQDHGR